MQLLSNENLDAYTTMKLGGPARFLADVSNKLELKNIVKWAHSHDLPIIPLGSGSNTIFTDEGIKGVVIVNQILGFEVLSQEEESMVLKIGSGEIWDQTVKKTVEMGLSGIEAMSKIPGTVGAAPVQNIGAYGQELSDVFMELEAYDMSSEQFTVFSKEQCQFGYRNSIFKNAKPHRYFITSVTIKLSKLWMTPPFYSALETYFTDKKLEQYSPGVIRDAVIEIRQSKLPDPKQIPNSGSFFKSPVITNDHFERLKLQYPDIDGYVMENELVKIPAGWLVENVGFKGVKEESGIGTYEKHALVIVNHSGAHYKDLEALVNKIKAAVKQKFDIDLEQEPELIVT